MDTFARYNENHRQEGTIFPMKKILKWTVLLVLAAAVCLVLGLFPDRLTALFQSLAAQML